MRSKNLDGNMHREISAGGMVWNKELKKILLIRDSYGRWALPKGMVEKGETSEQAALREITEETGLKDLKIIEKLGEVKYFYTLKGEKIFKIVVLFLVEAKDSELKPQLKEIQGAEWFDVEKAAETIEYKNTKNIMEKAVEKIGKLEK